MMALDKMRKHTHMRLTMEERQLIEDLRTMQNDLMKEYKIYRADDKNYSAITMSEFIRDNHKYKSRKAEIIKEYIDRIAILLERPMPDDFKSALEKFFDERL